MRLIRLAVPVLFVIHTLAAVPAAAVDRTWMGSADGLWSRPENWSPQGVPVDGDRLIFPNAFTVRAMTNDLAPVLLQTLVFPASAGPTSYAIDGNLLVLGGGTTGFATISAPVQLAANQTIEAVLTGTLDVGGHTVVLRRSHTGELVGTGSVVFSPMTSDPVTLVHPLSSFSGAISAGPPFVNATLAGSYPNASITKFWQVTVEGEQTVGDATFETLTLNHPAGDAYGLLHTGSLTFTIFPSAIPTGNPARWYLDIDADSSDRLDVTGTVSLETRAYLDITVLEPLTVGTVYTIVQNDGTDPVSGIFGGPAEFGQASEGAFLSKDGHTFRISYLGGDGNDVTLTVTAAPPAQVSVSGLDTNVFERDSGTTQAEVVINMNRTAASDVTVTYHTVDRTAQAGADYAARSGTIVIPAGSTGVILNIPVLGDTTPEDDETFAVILDAVSEGTIGDSEIVVGILDDDEPHIAVTAEDTSVVEGDFGIATVNVTLTLTEPATQSVNVQYHTEDGTALAGSDYNTATGSVTIPAGATTANIALTVVGDGVAENDETFTLVIDSAGDLQIVRPNITITILDDDPVYARVDGIVYGASGETLDLLLPVGNTRKIPAVVAFIESEDEAVVARQTARGYAVVVVSVRDTFPANLEDALAAIAWLRAHAHEHHIDATRIAAWGIGAGGNLAALLGTNAVTGRTHVDAVIDFYGETDFLDLDANPGACGLDYTPFFGCDPGVCRDAATAASPLAHVTPDDEPFLIVHATGDCVVPVAQSVRLHHALQADGVHSELVTVPGNRGPNVAASPSVVQAVDAFLDEMLGKGKTSRRRAARR